MNTSTLSHKLSAFKCPSDESELQRIFKELAPAFLYGGYINIHDEFKLYIRTVEFYFHSEKLEGIHDPIVYHRNGRCLDIVPYFPVMTLHAHGSGFDITFESEVGQYRASALIRSYELKDREGMHLKWDSGSRKFRRCKEYAFNTQSTYLYYLLNGFSLGDANSVRWVDAPLCSEVQLSVGTRQGVYESQSEFEYKPADPKVKCSRNWSFTRISKI